MVHASTTSREQRRRQLTDCARMLFSRQGYYATSVEDVIREAGVSRGTFYNYFDSKRVLFAEVLEELFQVVWESVPPILTGPQDDIPAQVVRNLHSLCATLEQNQDFARILFSEAVGLDPEADEQLARFYQRSMERLVGSLREGQELGIVMDGDPVVLAVCLLGIIKEYWFQTVLGYQPVPLDTFLTQVYRFLNQGLLRSANP